MRLSASKSLPLSPASPRRIDTLSRSLRSQAMCNDSADVVTSMLKPLVVRHTKAQTRNGQQLLALQPLQYLDELVSPTDAEAAAYAEAHAAARRTRASGVHRLHEHAHALLPLFEAASALVGELGATARTNRHEGLSSPRLSTLTAMTKRIEDRLPSHRDDFRIGVGEVRDAACEARASCNASSEPQLSLGALSCASSPL